MKKKPTSWAPWWPPSPSGEYFLRQWVPSFLQKAIIYSSRFPKVSCHYNSTINRWNWLIALNFYRSDHNFNTIVVKKVLLFWTLTARGTIVLMTHSPAFDNLSREQVRQDDGPQKKHRQGISRLIPWPCTQVLKNSTLQGFPQHHLTLNLVVPLMIALLSKSHCRKNTEYAIVKLSIPFPCNWHKSRFYLTSKSRLWKLIAPSRKRSQPNDEGTECQIPKLFVSQRKVNVSYSSSVVDSHCLFPTCFLQLGTSGFYCQLIQLNCN